MGGKRRRPQKITHNAARRVAYLGVLLALAMALSVVERLLVPLLGLAPGIKPGLANIVVMYLLCTQGLSYALMLAVLKAFFVMLLYGPLSAVLSGVGGLCAVLGMACVRRLRATWLIQSCTGAILHNMGQLAALSLLALQSIYTFYYLPVLLIAGLLTGSLTAVLLRVTMPLLKEKKKTY